LIDKIHGKEFIILDLNRIDDDLSAPVKQTQLFVDVAF